jgi:protein-disulfide isomerase
MTRTQKTLSITGFAFLLTAALAGCQRDDSATNEKLDKLLAKVEDLEKKVDRVGSARPMPGAQAPQPGRPDPTAVYSVPIDGNPVVGKPTAKVTIVEAYEYACPFCRRVNPTIDELKKQYGDDLRVAYKQYVVHPQVATTPALAVCAAHKQGKFHDLSNMIWEKSWPDGRMGDLSENTIMGYAKDLGLNLEKFKADLGGEECKKTIADDQAALARVGVRGTPAFFINGRFLSGAQPIENFKAIIDEEMKKADAAIKAGKKPEEYYSSIVASGKKSL